MRNLKRIGAIATLINDKDKTVADIGADHGYLTKVLIEENRAKAVIATDISKASLEKTANLAKKYGFLDKIFLKVGDGLKILNKGEAQIVVIAGMGGNEIIKILEENTDKTFDKFIFQPMQNTINLREYLIKHNYEIIKDFIVKDRKKFYNTIVARFSTNKQNLSKKQIEFGLTNLDLKGNDFIEYLSEYINNNEIIYEKSKSKIIKEKINMAKEVLAEVKN